MFKGIINYYRKLLAFMLVISAMMFYLYLQADKRGVFMPAEEKAFYKSLSDFRESGKEKMLLKELTNFEWDKVCYIGPYTWPSDGDIIAQNKLNKEPQDSNDDGKISLIFLNNKKKTGFVFILERGAPFGVEFTKSICLEANKTYLKVGKFGFLLILE